MPYVTCIAEVNKNQSKYSIVKCLANDHLSHSSYKYTPCYQWPWFNEKHKKCVTQLIQVILLAECWTDALSK